jgi:hypothetical protein
MELEGSLPHSEARAACPYPEPAQSSLCPHPIPLISIKILFSLLGTGIPSGSVLQVFLIKVLYAPFLSPYVLRATPLVFRITRAIPKSTSDWLVKTIQKREQDLIIWNSYTHNCITSPHSCHPHLGTCPTVTLVL